MSDLGQTKVEKLLQPVAEGLGYEWVGSELVSQGRDGLLRVYLDKPGGITIDDCSQAFQQFVAVLTVEGLNQLYKIEVSSPGLDRPLFAHHHWQQAIGKQVKIKLRYPVEEKRQYSGLLKSQDENDVVIQVGTALVTLPFAAVSKANLVPEISFKKTRDVPKNQRWSKRGKSDE